MTLEILTSMVYKIIKKYTSSFNNRVGDIKLNSTDVINALGYTPASSGAGTVFYTTITVIAGENISGGKATIIDTDGKAYIYNINNDLHYGKFSGIAKTAASIGASIDIFTSGAASEVGSGWLEGMVYYIGSTGLLTTTPPTTGNIKIIGVGISTDTVLLNGTVEVITI